LPLDGTFGLHPALAQMHSLYRGELLVVHATGLAYHQRSHFDAQQVLESGGEQPGQLRDGWLGRALAATRRSGLAMSTAVPLVLRGWSGWTPGRPRACRHLRTICWPACSVSMPTTRPWAMR
jgi:uncharacterized protein (DUF1501 family)